MNLPEGRGDRPSSGPLLAHRPTPPPWIPLPRNSFENDGPARGGPVADLRRGNLIRPRLVRQRRGVQLLPEVAPVR